MEAKESQILISIIVLEVEIRGSKIWEQEEVAKEVL